MVAKYEPFLHDGGIGVSSVIDRFTEQLIVLRSRKLEMQIGRALIKNKQADLQLNFRTLGVHFPFGSAPSANPFDSATGFWPDCYREH